MNISIKSRIHWSFFVLAFIFIANAVVTLVVLFDNKKTSQYISGVAYPSIQSLHDFRKVIRESMMFTTNWVFIRSDDIDKNSLKEIHETVYPALREELRELSGNWHEKRMRDSLEVLFNQFDSIIKEQRSIMNVLNEFKDYNDPLKKFGAENHLESIVLPLSMDLSKSVERILQFETNVKTAEEEKFAKASVFLRTLITLLTISTVCLGLFFSVYMTRKIIRPIEQLRSIVNDLGKGITRRIESAENSSENSDEIGKMVRSVNNLSDKLRNTAQFAFEIGLRNFDAQFQPLGNEDTLGKALISMRDNLKNSDHQLLDANAEIQTVFDASLDAIVIIDEEGKIIKWDDKAASLFGWEERDILGLELSNLLIPARFRDAHRRGMQHFLSTRESKMLGKTIEVSALKKNGDEFEISLSVSPSLIKGKYRFIGFIRDITSRKIAERQLQVSEERYRRIVETAQEGIWVLDENDNTSFVNKKMADILGYTQEEMLGKPSVYFLGETTSETLFDRSQRRKVGIQDSYDNKYITKSGKTVWANLSTTPMLDEQGNYSGCLAMVMDITQRKLDEEQLRSSEAVLETKNKELELKNKELEQFAYVASHDLQEPLRTTSSFVELLQQQYAGRLDKQADTYLTYIIQSSDRMKVLIKDLLDYSRIGKKKELEVIDCNVALQQVLADLGKAIQDGKATINAGKLPVIKGYITEVMELFQNLILNAIKFRKKDVDPVISITAERAGNHWTFSLQDNGIGIENEHRERVFIIFQRLHTRSEYEGSGIGLAHCKKIVELHGGLIWIVAPPEGGTIFHFTLPAIEQALKKTTSHEKKTEMHTAH
jgi:PAS domain S-box-containing protein